MRKIRVNLVMFLVLLVIAACAGRTFLQNTYASMYVAGSTYDTGMKIVSDLQKQGKITQVQRDEINKYANAFYVAYHLAVDALSVYQQTSSASDKDKLSVALAAIPGAWANLATNVNRVIPNTLSPTLPK